MLSSGLIGHQVHIWGTDVLSGEIFIHVKEKLELPKDSRMPLFVFFPSFTFS